ncbi:heme-binding protein [Pseudovibrio exalbescens]|uniref:GlcG/HbpS family heme-binding protein n=1 Tax=Pseudovibrio exalbescens TaxID=197461 RepID=UPI0023654736|nr:heme-binding protein [Pseudovibrio exalbescens]MDD7909421.1 heme-binding protein [Pseudovibrio exalbescens]
MPVLNLATARNIIATAYQKSGEEGFKPLTIAVLDEGGHLIAVERQDGSSFMRPQIAIGKAYGAVALGEGSRWLNENAQTRPHFVQALNGVAGGGIVPVPGGVLIRDPETAKVVGAAGVTGDTSDNDEICAIAGIEAAGFTADVG